MCDCENTDWIEYAHELESEVRTLQQRIVELEVERDSVCHLNDSLSLERDELAATVEGLREALRHLHHNAKASGAEMGLALDVAEEVLESTPQQNLAEHDVSLLGTFTDWVVEQIREIYQWEGAIIEVDAVVKGLKSSTEQYAQRIKDGE